MILMERNLEFKNLDNESMLNVVAVENNNFPTDVLKWMKKNAKPFQSLKLMQICKSFQHQKFPYFVIKKLKWDGRISFKTLDGEWHNIDDINLIPNNLWIITELFLKESNTFSHLFPKIAYNSIKYLFLFNQNISFNEFKVLTNVGKVELLDLHLTFIRHENGNIIFLESLFECLPNIEDISIFGSVPLIYSLHNLNNVFSQNMRTLNLYPSSETFNIEVYTTFIKNHQNILYIIRFGENFSSEYIRRLQIEKDNINKTWSSEIRPPIFSFHGSLR